MPAIVPPLAVLRWQIVLREAAATASEISESPRARVAPGGVGSVARRVDGVVVQHAPAAAAELQVWDRAAAEAAAVAEGGKRR